MEKNRILEQIKHVNIEFQQVEHNQEAISIEIKTIAQNCSHSLNKNLLENLAFQIHLLTTLLGQKKNEFKELTKIFEQ